VIAFCKSESIGAPPVENIDPRLLGWDIVDDNNDIIFRYILVRVVDAPHNLIILSKELITQVSEEDNVLDSSKMSKKWFLV
jgi:hypothetical protein